MWYTFWKRWLNRARQTSPKPTPKWRLRPPSVEELGPRWVPAVSPLLTPEQAIAEVGSNDFSISHMGPDGNGNYDASDAAVAYNPTNNEYLVVWSGDDNTGTLKDDEFEIFGQRINAATGAKAGGRIRISDMGPDGDPKFDAYQPAVAYNGTNNEYLVVWHGDRNFVGASVDEEFEIFGQRLNAATGEEVGTDDFRISSMGPIDDPSFGAFHPAVAYNGTDNEYLVVWSGNDNTAPLTGHELEIYGQRLAAATGLQVGDDDFRISDISFNAVDPAVAFNAASHEYLVVWEGADDTGPLMNSQFEIYGQRLNAAGKEVGANDFRISDMGPEDNTHLVASDAAVAYDGAANEYLVVWSGDDVTEGEFEIYGQRLNAAGAEVGVNDFRISDMGPDGFADFDATNPAVA